MSKTEAARARILASRLIYERWSEITEVNMRMPNGAIETRFIEDHGDAAAVLLFDPTRRVALMIEQPRAPLVRIGAEPILEVVAGAVDGKSFEETARAEAFEEAGVKIRDLTHICTVATCPAVSTEHAGLFLAEYCDADRVGPGGGAEDENECIIVHEISLSELWSRVEAGEIQELKALLLLQALRLRRPELFEPMIVP